jgi:hypothetical protein
LQKALHEAPPSVLASLLGVQWPMANHSFAVGETYRDLRGAYTVVSIEDNRLVYDYGDGTEHIGDAETKWQIYYNNFLSRASANHALLANPPVT